MPHELPVLFFSNPLFRAFHHLQASYTIPIHRTQKIYTRAILASTSKSRQTSRQPQPKHDKSILIMGCAESREYRGPDNHGHRKHHPSSHYYDWDKEEGGYTPYRFQGQHRRRWHQEDKTSHTQEVRNAAERERNRRALKHYDANDEKAKAKTHYNKHVGRKLEEAYRHQVRDAAERERHCEALKYYDVHEKRGNLRRPHDEERRRKAAAGKTEKIKVYASPDLKSRWSD